MTNLQKREMSDAALARLVQSGDADALGALFDRYDEMVYRVAYRLLGRREDAEDAVQDVFGGLRVALAKYVEGGSLDSWLRRVTVRTALMKRRAEARRPAESFAEADATPRIDRDAALAISIEDAIAALPAPLRSVVVLRIIEGYSHEEIAQLLDISVGASKVRLHRAVQRLRTALGDFVS
ncbi:MAG: RNA polymerase sigma factor [Gemmatimonadaceae bacterium]